jgi:hypothetical protein
LHAEYSTPFEEQKSTANYAEIHHILGQFCSKSNEVLFLDKNWPEIQRILEYFAVTLYSQINRILKDALELFEMLLKQPF